MDLAHLDSSKEEKKTNYTSHSVFCPSAVCCSFLYLCFSFSPILQFYSPYLIIQQCQCLHCTNGTRSCYWNIDAVIALHVFAIHISYMTFCDKCGFLSFTFCFQLERLNGSSAE